MLLVTMSSDKSRFDTLAADSKNKIQNGSLLASHHLTDLLI